MKTLKNIWTDITSINNIELAYKKAKKGKSHYRAVKEVEKAPRKYLLHLQSLLREGTYRTSEYSVSEELCGSKVRVLHKLPFFPDRVAHHAFMNLVSEFWKRSLIRDTFQSIEGRGTSDCISRVRSAIHNDRPLFAKKLDVVKYYPSLTNDITIDPKLYKLGDAKAQDFLFELLGSLPVTPLGNHPSQYVGNLAISDIDWHAKQKLGIKHYYRYCDDIVIMGDSLGGINEQTDVIKGLFADKGLRIKEASNVLNLQSDLLDFVGVRLNHSKMLLRKSISDNFKLAIKTRNLDSIPSYYGWCKQARAEKLFQKHHNILQKS